MQAVKDAKTSKELMNKYPTGRTSEWSLGNVLKITTAWKVSKYGVISVAYFPVFSLNTGKYGTEITLYLDTFHAVNTGKSFYSMAGKVVKTLIEDRQIRGQT